MKGYFKCGFLLQHKFTARLMSTCIGGSGGVGAGDPDPLPRPVRKPQVAICCYIFPSKYWYGPPRELLLDDGPYGSLSNT